MILIFSSCTKDSDTPECVVVSPDSYVFEVSGSSTVTYGGQTTRLQMHDELHAALSNSATTEAMLNGMFDHQAGNQDFSDPILNASSKQIKSKTAGYQSEVNKLHVHMKINEWFNDYANNVAPAIASSTMAAPGIPGMIDNRELNAKGMEYDQVVTKSLIGALCLDQIVEEFLHSLKMRLVYGV